MAETFHLQIVSLDGLMFDGQARSAACRTIHGDMAILARHCNYCTAIGMGKAQVVLEDGTERFAACTGGMLSMMNGECRLIATTWEWSDEIDIGRALKAKEKMEKRLAYPDISDQEFKLAQSKLNRALVRISAARPPE